MSTTFKVVCLPQFDAEKIETHDSQNLLKDAFKMSSLHNAHRGSCRLLNTPFYTEITII